MQMANEIRFAVLIDAENISDKYIKTIFDEISNDGIVTYKRIYSDWTKPSVGPWKHILLDHSILPVQQYSYTTGKSASDSAMIIDAMDILYSGQVEGFCLVSSDSDFTRLAARLRESGMIVVGMGERKTPKPFISACNRFKYLDILATDDSRHPKEQNAVKKPIVFRSKSPETPPVKEYSELDAVRESIRAIIAENSDEDGWMFIGQIGNLLVKRHPDFDVRNFGFNKLSLFINSLESFEKRSENTPDANGRLIYAKIK
jgi:hypothetical protein